MYWLRTLRLCQTTLSNLVHVMAWYHSFLIQKLDTRPLTFESKFFNYENEFENVVMSAKWRPLCSGRDVFVKSPHTCYFSNRSDISFVSVGQHGMGTDLEMVFVSINGQRKLVQYRNRYHYILPRLLVSPAWVSPQTAMLVGLALVQRRDDSTDVGPTYIVVWNRSLANSVTEI